MRPGLPFLIVVAIAGSSSACSLRFFDRWDADVVRAAELEQSPAVVWQQLHTSAREAGLLLAALRPDDRVIEFAWQATSGDGAAYLDCAAGGAVGSASLRPRVTLVETPFGTRVEVSSLVHATAASRCTSNGNFESWLLQRLRIPGADERVAATPPTPSPQ